MAAHGITGDAAFALRSQPAMSKPVMSPASSGWRWNRRAVIEQAKLPPVRAGAVTDTGGELQGVALLLDPRWMCEVERSWL